EALNSFYQNHGYIRFNVSSVQVSMSPDKKSIYITISVNEGAQYTVSGYKVAGDIIVPQTAVERFISIAKGQIFNRANVSASAGRISDGLADLGYAFSEVDPLTRINDQNDTVALTFYVKPGKRSYVRRVTFSGNEQTNDKTLRREMRQLEGAPYSRRAVQRSRTRLARLPYIQDVQVETDSVAGTEDLVDVNYDVEERPAGKLQFGVGYSDSEGVLLNGSISHDNFRGTGDKVSIGAQTTDNAKAISTSWTDPYFTEDGISRTFSAYYRDIDRINKSTAGYDITAVGAGVDFGIPISEYSQFSLGGGLKYYGLTDEPSTPDQVQDFIREQGDDSYMLGELRAAWTRDTRDKSFFATR